MCLILLAHRVHPDYPLIVAANRDEFYARATASAHYWQKPLDILAGRDLEAGGTWLGVSRTGRFAAVTNFTEPPPMEVLRSRGELTTNFLASDQSSEAYGEALVGGDYRGFNLLLWDGSTLYYESNRNAGRSLGPGIYGLANATLDEEKYRVTSGRDGLKTLLEGSRDAQALSDTLLGLLAGREHPDAPTDDNTIDPARLARFIASDEYGTRASAVLLLGQERVHFSEQSYLNGGEARGLARFEFALAQSA